MNFINKLIGFRTNYFILFKIQKKIAKFFNIKFVPTKLKKLPKNQTTSNIIFRNTKQYYIFQKKILIEYKKKKNLVSFNTYPKMHKMLKMLFLKKNVKFNFLDFGGENIDFYLHLKSKFKNINYFIYNKKEINQVFLKLKKEYKLKNIIVLKNIDTISKYKYDFICFGSVIHYLDNYNSVLKLAAKVSKKYIFFSGTTFFSKNVNKKENIIAKQVNFLPKKIYIYFFNSDIFLNFFSKNKFHVVFNEKSTLGNINYKNFKNLFGEITYTNLLLSL